MKAVILAGGMGTRISEETHLKPKPMIEIGGKPILWHIMKIYASHGVTDFIVCLGYKGYMIKEYFAHYFLHMSDVTVDLKTNQLKFHNNKSEPWTLSLVDTGEDTMTGGRLRRIQPYVEKEKFFHMTYGDGVSDVNITQVTQFHQSHGLLATVTATQPPGRFGTLEMDGPRITSFQEKPHGDGGWINGGFFVLSPQVLEYIEGDQTIWEKDPMERLVTEGQLAAHLHRGFWRPMDTLRDKVFLEETWATGNAPWKVWV